MHSIVWDRHKAIVCFSDFLPADHVVRNYVPNRTWNVYDLETMMPLCKEPLSAYLAVYYLGLFRNKFPMLNFSIGYYREGI